MSKTGYLLFTATLLFGAQTAFADHGKIGAWHLETQAKVADPHGAMMYMSSWEVTAVKEAYSKKSRADYCMRAEDVKADAIRIWIPNCSVGPTTVSGPTLQANYQCTGKLAGSGQMTVTYDSPEHYTGQSVFALVKGGGLESHSTYDARWTGETCPAP